MRQPHTIYPVRGALPVLGSDNNLCFLHVAASLPSYTSTFMKLVHQPSEQLPADDLTKPLAKIPVSKHGVVQNGTIELSSRITVDNIEALDVFTRPLEIGWMYSNGLIIMGNPLEEKVLPAYGANKETIEFHGVTNQAILLGAVRALAMQHERAFRT